MPTQSRYLMDAGVYDTLAHSPGHSFVIVSYSVFKRAIKQQFEELVEGGITFLPQLEDPYANSREMITEVQEHFRLRVYADHGATLPDDHPMKERVEAGVDGISVYNDLFRAVHDILGHVAADSSFGPNGEERAWRAHQATLPRIAWSALWCETRGQTAWTNYAGDHQGYPLKDRPFGEQKAGLIPALYVS